VKAIDTNIVIRFLVCDHPDQAPAARAVVAANCFVSLTVLLETAWVLTSRYRFSRAETGELLSSFIDLPSVAVEELDAVRWAVARFEAGADVADMIHLAACRSAETFVTFDRSVSPAAGPDTPVAIETLA
jgi:predicted nucleic-acid-binding protein